MKMNTGWQSLLVKKKQTLRAIDKKRKELILSNTLKSLSSLPVLTAKKSAKKNFEQRWWQNQNVKNSELAWYHHEYVKHAFQLTWQCCASESVSEALLQFPKSQA